MGKTLQEIIAERSGKNPIVEKAKVARSQDYLDSRGVQTPMDILAIRQAEEKLAKLNNRTVQTYNGVPVADVKDKTQERVDLMKVQKEEAELLKPKGRPTDTVEKEKLKTILESEQGISNLNEAVPYKAVYDEDGEPVLDSNGEQKYEEDPSEASLIATEVFRRRAETSVDTLNIINQIQSNLPMYKGDNFDQIMANLKDAKETIEVFKSDVEREAEIVISNGPQELRDNPYYAQKVRDITQQKMLNNDPSIINKLYYATYTDPKYDPEIEIPKDTTVPFPPGGYNKPVSPIQ